MLNKTGARFKFRSYKTAEINEDVKKYIKKFDITKIKILPKLKYRFNAITIKTTPGFNVEKNKSIVKFM